MLNIDLFTPVIPKKQMHPNFCAIIKANNNWNLDVLNDWASGFVDRDGKFVKQFQSTFNSCFWELYLNAVMKDYNLSIDFSFPSPDFTITKPYLFTIEAVTTNSAKGDLSEYEAYNIYPTDLNEFNRNAIIRLSSALHTKHEQYKKKYEKLPHVIGKPYIIAIAPFDHSNGISCQRAVEAALFNYYIDEEDFIKKKQYDFIPKGFLSSVIKNNGAIIKLGAFQEPLMPEVSAVIFNSCATWGKIRALSNDPNPYIFFTALRASTRSIFPDLIQAQKKEYKEDLLDGLRIYHNPFATYPVSPAIFRRKGVFQAYHCNETHQRIYEQEEGILLFRSVKTFLPKI